MCFLLWTAAFLCDCYHLFFCWLNFWTKTRFLKDSNLGPICLKAAVLPPWMLERLEGVYEFQKTPHANRTKLQQRTAWVSGVWFMQNCELHTQDIGDHISAGWWQETDRCHISRYPSQSEQTQTSNAQLFWLRHPCRTLLSSLRFWVARWTPVFEH